MRICRVSLLTFIVFLTLRLCGATEWHWGWVLCPLFVCAGGIAREGEIEKVTGQDFSNA